MKTERSKYEKFQRCLRLYLSDFFHLFTPGEKKVYTWKEIMIGFIILSVLLFLASLSAI